MIAWLGQAAGEVARSGSSITGTFVLDGALLIASLKLIEAGVSKYKSRNGNGKKAGESPTCREHGEAISALKEFKDNASDTMARIETKVDAILARGSK